MLLKQYWDDFLNVLFPDLCVACSDRLLSNEQILCTECRITLPLTNYHLQFDNNPVLHHLTGKVNVQGAFSMFHFNKGGKIQEMIHQLKYEGREDIGTLLGHWYSRELIEAGFGDFFDLIIPIPLHPKRLAYRGYNQCTTFSKAMALSLQAEYRNDLLMRSVSTHTQTQKNRLKRWENMQEVFYLNHEEEITGKQVLIIDDVITTGATLEVATQRIITAKPKNVMIATIASAKF